MQDNLEYCCFGISNCCFEISSVALPSLPATLSLPTLPPAGFSAGVLWLGYSPPATGDPRFFQGEGEGETYRSYIGIHICLRAYVSSADGGYIEATHFVLCLHSSATPAARYSVLHSSRYILSEVRSQFCCLRG